jgi:hypothetical protein
VTTIHYVFLGIVFLVSVAEWGAKEDIMDGGHCRVRLAGGSGKAEEAMDELPEDIEGANINNNRLTSRSFASSQINLVVLEAMTIAETEVT